MIKQSFPPPPCISGTLERCELWSTPWCLDFANNKSILYLVVMIIFFPPRIYPPGHSTEGNKFWFKSNVQFSFRGEPISLENQEREGEYKFTLRDCKNSNRFIVPTKQNRAQQIGAKPGRNSPCTCARISPSTLPYILGQLERCELLHTPWLMFAVVHSNFSQQETVWAPTPKNVGWDILAYDPT